jgi:energy-coupling factor transport system ATP-binding protein
MIRADDLTFAYAARHPGDHPKEVLRGCTLHLDAGQALAVMGISGAGKSTLGYVMAGLAPRHTGGTLSGSLTLNGKDVTSVPPQIGSVGLLFQDAAVQLFNTTVEDEVAWGLEAMGLPPDEIDRRVRASLARFDLERDRRRPPWALSGGQQKRLALAALSAMRPQVLILDEPLGGLDLQGRREVLSAIQALQASGTVLLVMTLRLETAATIDRVALLVEGRLSDPLPTGAAISKSRLVERLVEAGLHLPPASWPDLSPQRPLSSDPPALELKALHFDYPHESGDTRALRGIDFAIPSGQFVALIGPNGAGKSTLVRHLNGLLRPTSGTVHVLGAPIGNRATGEMARQVGFLFQRPEQQLFAPTVREEVAYGPTRLGPTVCGRPTLGVDPHVDRVLRRFGLEDVAGAPPALLGYGAQRTVTLASLAALATPIVVLDEPTVGLDGRGMAQLLSWLRDLRADGVTIVLVTHEMALAARADRVIALDAGQIVADGPPATVLGEEVAAISKSRSPCLDSPSGGGAGGEGTR